MTKFQWALAVFVKGGIGRKFQRFHAEHHAWPSVPSPRRMGQRKMGYFPDIRCHRMFLGHHFRRRVCAPRRSSCAGARIMTPFHHCLAADQRFLPPAFQNGEHLQVSRKSKKACDYKCNVSVNYYT